MEPGCGGCPLALRVLQAFVASVGPQPGHCFAPAWVPPASRPESYWKLSAKLSFALHQHGADEGKTRHFKHIFWAGVSFPAPKQIKRRVSETPFPDLCIQQALAFC